MSEKLIIKNFGPIKSAEIELKRFTVLIGEQATGKSTIAKLLAVCRYFSYITPIEGFKEGLSNWGLEDYINKKTQISYSNRDYEFKTEQVNENESGYLLSLYLKGKSTEFKELQNYSHAYYNSQVPPSFFKSNVARIMDNPFFLPVERGLQSFFSIGKGGIQNISDSLFNQFAKLDQVSKSFNIETIIEPIGITYKNESGFGRFKKKNEDEFHSLNNAASGYQSTIPIVVACKYYHEQREKSKTFIIEEPELNLFPISQKNLVDFLVQESNKVQKNNAHSQFLLTTHSPYILTSLSNCLYANKIGKVHEREVAKVVPKKNWLDSTDLSAYLLKKDGTVEDIFDKKSGLIKAEKIDKVSSVLNKQFDQLLKIEFQK